MKDIGHLRIENSEAENARLKKEIEKLKIDNRVLYDTLEFLLRREGKKGNMWVSKNGE